MLFDIRTIVGSLLSIYGVVLLVTGLVHNTAAEQAKTGGWNVNLWSGIGLVVVGLAFIAWVLLRPVEELASTPPADPETPLDPEGIAPAK
ncbi:hypothetical protein [Nocardia harenae]|uniref:hypothetical protein n=1 Tax=Nocardia harenae TaxID=358707 RepID=UPI00083743BD|nr:hypothetical protein [Nocardia harenae]